MLLAVASATSGASAVTITSTGTLQGAGQLAGTCSIGIGSTTTASGSNLDGAAALSISGTATLQAVNSAAGVCSLTLDSTGLMGGAPAVPLAQRIQLRKWRPEPLDFTIYQNKMVIMSLPNAVGVSGQCDISITPTAIMRGAAVIAGSGGMSFGGTGTLSAAGNLAGSSALTITPAAPISGTASGAVTGVASAVFTGLGAAQGSGRLFGAASQAFNATMVTGSEQLIAGASVIAFLVAGTLSATQPVLITTPRSRTVLVHNRRRR